MAIIYSYPQATPTALDYIIGTVYQDDSLATKSFSMQDIINLAVAAVPVPAGGWTGVFNTNDILEVSVLNGIITNVVVVG